MNRAAPSIEEIFFGALEAGDPKARAGYLAEACGLDSGLRRRVERMLAASPLVGNFLESPVTTPTVSADSLLPECVGTVVGPYTLVEPIGEGGMGAVFMAEQKAPVRRCVALKVIKPGMDTKQVIARFETERQALALMDHPGIAKVLDAGTTDGGRPYFVMELVRGVPITQFCDELRLSHRGRLELFVLVCGAIQHAHQKGFIHRDIKPSNVLVAMVDGKPVPKVIDFGVARAIDARLTERTMFTQHGVIVGTPEYMSPEQAEPNGLNVDTRSDVYALGVLLYELLTGSTPLERAFLRQAAYSEILRRIKEVEPPRPSSRLSDSGDRIAALAARRRTEPARLAKQVRGELDWIVMKALDKDSSRRYETASGLARDIERHLVGDPVEAGPPSASYKLRKFAGKHRATLAALAVSAAVLLIGATAGTYLAVRATAAERLASRRLSQVERANTATTLALAEITRAKSTAEAAEKAARAEADKSHAINAFLTEDLLTQAEPANNAAEDHVTLLDVLDRAAGTVGDRFRGSPEVEEALRRTIARTYHGLASWAKAERQWRAVLDSSRRRLGRESSDALLAQGELAHILRHLGRLDEALPMAQQAVDGLDQVLGHDHSETLVSRGNLANTYLAAGRTAEAIALHEETLKLREARLGADHSATLAGRANLANAYLAAGQTAEATAIYEATLEQREAELGADHPTTLVSRNNLANAYLAGGRTDEAISLHEETLERSTFRLGTDHPTTLVSRSNLARAYHRGGNPAKALKLFESVLESRVAKLGADHPETLLSRDKLATAYRDAGRTSEALAMYEGTLELREAKLGANHPTTVASRNKLARAYLAADQYDKAEALLHPEDRDALMPNGVAAFAR